MRYAATGKTPAERQRAIRQKARQRPAQLRTLRAPAWAPDALPAMTTAMVQAQRTRRLPHPSRAGVLPMPATRTAISVTPLGPTLEGLGFSLKPPKWLRKAQPGKLLKKAAPPLAIGASLFVPGVAPAVAAVGKGIFGAAKAVGGGLFGKLFAAKAAKAAASAVLPAVTDAATTVATDTLTAAGQAVVTEALAPAATVTTAAVPMTYSVAAEPMTTAAEGQATQPEQAGFGSALPMLALAAAGLFILPKILPRGSRR